MYTLLSGLYKQLTQKDEFFVLILGLDNAGKTTFLESAKTRQPAALCDYLHNSEYMYVTAYIMKCWTIVITTLYTYGGNKMLL